MPDRRVTVRLRPEVQWFAEQMEKRLRKHDRERGKQGWHGESEAFLRERVDEELEELDRAMDRRSVMVIGEAADAANFLMMLADNDRRDRENARRCQPCLDAERKTDG